MGWWGNDPTSLLCNYIPSCILITNKTNLTPTKILINIANTIRQITS